MAASDRTLRILVVEDHRDAGDTLTLLLESWGHVVVLRRDGRTALEAAESLRFDVALVDLQLPGPSGYDVGQALRDRSGAPWLVALSAFSQPEDVEHAAAAGFDRHVTKPAGESTLRSILDEACTRSGSTSRA